MNIPIPKRLMARPRYRGLPVPYIAVMKSNGEPDFRAIDEQKRYDVMLNRICQLCGIKLGKYLCFVGGPEAAKGNQYYEPPAHLDCLIYAMQVCPFIVGKIEHADIAKVQAKIQLTDPDMLIRTDETFSPKRDPRWIIKKALNYRFAITPGKTVLLLPVDVQYQTEPLYPDKMGPVDWYVIKKELEINEKHRSNSMR